MISEAAYNSASKIDESNKEDDEKRAEYLELHRAATRGDWTTAKRIFDQDPDALTAPLSELQHSVLHVAVVSSRANNMAFLEKLVELMVQKGTTLASRNYYGLTPLHYAAESGNTKAVSLLVEKDPTLTQNLDSVYNAPLHVAAFYEHEETIRYLLQVTLRMQPSLLHGSKGANFLVNLIMDGFYDLAFQVLEEYPGLSAEQTWIGITPLVALAQQPQAFQSGIRLTFWQHLLLHVWDRMLASKSNFSQEKDVENSAVHKLEFNWKRAPPFQLFKRVREEKLKQKQVLKLLKSLVEKASRSRQPAVVLGSALRMAAQNGIVEFVEEAIRAYPLAVNTVDFESRNIFNIAVIYRQEKIFNLIFQLGSWKHLTMVYDKYSCNMLHHAAQYHLTAKINKIPGAALQMQRELQWYKVVEKIVQPSYKVTVNNENKMPDMVFIDSHKELVDQGEKWMKDTTNSYTIVAALVVTITFAAAFTVPGGNNNDKGIPIFLNDTSFMFFAIADAFALFSSTTSLVMFLGILTSRYSPEDFLKTLPMRLAIGLITLFFSIASMLVAFTASMHIMLSHRLCWIIIPIGSLACLPLLLFAFLQFPLLLEVLYSTFGPSIFHKQSDEMLI